MEHRLPTERRVAFESFETGRRFLVCAQPVRLMLSHVHCNIVTTTDDEAHCLPFSSFDASSTDAHWNSLVGYVHCNIFMV